MVKLYEFVPKLLKESSNAADQAHKLGLSSAGWGYWKDKSGKTVAQTIDDQLVKLEDHPDAFEEYLNAFTSDVRSRLGLKSFEVWERPNTNDLHLSNLIVSKDKQGQGIGSTAMEELTQFADQHGKRITLTPAQKDSNHGTTSQSRLIKFYKQFGFVLNKGRNKDYRISDLMYRDPKRRG